MEIKTGCVLMSLDPKKFSDVFYDVLSVGPTKTDKNNWLKLRGKTNGAIESWPLLMADGKFLLVPTSTVQILFGANKDGNETKSSSSNVKSLRREIKRPASKKL